MLRIRTMYGDSLRFSAENLSFAYGLNGNTSYTEYGFAKGQSGSATFSGETYYYLSSPGANGTNSATINFVTTNANQKVTFRIGSQSEANYDFMCLGNLNSSSIDKCAALISGNPAITSYTFTVAAAGAHYVKLFYKKDHSTNTGNDRGYFKMVPYTNQKSTLNVDTETIRIDARKAWSVTSKPSWLTLSVSSGAKGVTDIIATSEVNKSSSIRTGNIVIKDSAGKEYTLTVAQTASVNSVESTRDSFYETYVSGSDTFAVGLNGNSSWSVSSYSGSSNFFSISPTGGTSSTTATVTWTQNTSSSPRQCKVTIKGNLGGTDTINIYQEGRYCSCDCQSYCTCDCNSYCDDASYDCDGQTYCTCHSVDYCTCDGKTNCSCDGQTNCACDDKTNCSCDGKTNCSCDDYYTCTCDSKTNCNCDDQTNCNCDSQTNCACDDKTNCNCDSKTTCSCDSQTSCGCDEYDYCTCDNQTFCDCYSKDVCNSHCTCNCDVDGCNSTCSSNKICNCDCEQQSHCYCNCDIDGCKCNCNTDGTYCTCNCQGDGACTCDCDVDLNEICPCYVQTFGCICEWQSKCVCYSQDICACNSQFSCTCHGENVCICHGQTTACTECSSESTCDFEGCTIDRPIICQDLCKQDLILNYGADDSAVLGAVTCVAVVCTCDCNLQNFSTCEHMTSGCYCDCQGDVTCTCDCDSEGFCTVNSCPTQIKCTCDCEGEGDCMSYCVCDSKDTCTCDSKTYCDCHNQTNCSCDSKDTCTCYGYDYCYCDAEWSCTCHSKDTCSSKCTCDCESKGFCNCNCYTNGCLCDCENQYGCTCNCQGNGACTCNCYGDGKCTCDCEGQYDCTCDCEGQGACTCNCDDDGKCTCDCDQDGYCSCNCNTQCSTDYCYDCSTESICTCNGYVKPTVGS